jgi:hypothetical protein
LVVSRKDFVLEDFFPTFHFIIFLSSLALFSSSFQRSEENEKGKRKERKIKEEINVGKKFARARWASGTGSPGTTV